MKEAKTKTTHYEFSVQGGVGTRRLLNTALTHLKTDRRLTSSPSGRSDKVEQMFGSWVGSGDHTHANAPEEIVIAALSGDKLALLKKESHLCLPYGPGSGEVACRNLMRDLFGSPEGQLSQIKESASVSAALKPTIWIARRLPRGIQERTSDSIEWLPYSSILDLAGSPVLRDARTLSALNAFARSPLLTGNQDLPSLDSTLSHQPKQTSEETAGNEVLSSLRRPTLSFAVLNPNQPTPEQFINADLSWLEFNSRVLALAENPYTPLKARIRFLAIVSTNLDEFFKVKVAGIKAVIAAGKDKQTADGMTPTERLNAIVIRVRALLNKQTRCFEHLRSTDLRESGFRILNWDEIPSHDRPKLVDYFEGEIYPLLTPHAITLSPGHIFPFIEEDRLALAIMFRENEKDSQHFSQVKIPGGLPRFVQIGESLTFVSLEEIVRGNIASLFENRIVDSVHPFRVTRYGDLDVDEETAASFDQAIEEAVRKRIFAPVIRIELERGIPEQIKNLLLEELRFEDANQDNLLGDPDIFELEGILDLGGLSEIADAMDGTHDYPPITPREPLPADRSIFDLIKENDILVHHPFDSFQNTFERFIVEAADDPDVSAIKLTLYRPGRGGSPISDALTRAAASGKDVAVFVELKARFDEEKNLAWAKQLKEAGIHVVTGLVKFKTHAKVAFVVRRSKDGLQRFSHIGTGNCNPDTAKVYTDLGLFTADSGINDDIQLLFNELTGSSGPPRADFDNLLVAPVNIRSRFLKLIKRETEHARLGKATRIRAKMNALQDEEIIAALYEASEAGVEIDLVVRGFCTLRPGVPGLSDRIRVYSIVGRFLEHARIFHFENAGDPEYYIGSADWRPRNLNRRVEVVTPVKQPHAKQMLDYILSTELDDPLAWELRSDGSHAQVPAPIGMELTTSQERFSRKTE